MAGCGGQIKGKSKALQPVCILLFHPAFSGSSGQGPVFLRSKARSLFLFEDRRDARKSPDSLRDDLDFLFISRLVEISCFVACISPGS